MRAVVLRAVGGPDELRIDEVERPTPSSADAVVSVRAAAVNYADVLMRSGRYSEAVGLPFVPGFEVAGEIIDAPAASALAPGARVIALPPHGGYAEEVAVDARWTFPLPGGATASEGAAFLVAFLTAYLPLTRQASVGPGDWVLVRAAAGGVGSAAVQVARQLGAHVVATAGSADKLAVAARLGAEVCLEYGEGDLRARVLEATGGRAMDVVLDGVGGAGFEESLRLLRPFGTLAAVGFAAGPLPPLDPVLLLGRSISVAGLTLGRLMRLEPEIVAAAARKLLALWERGAVHPVVGAELPLARAADAHGLLEARRSIGKVVLVP